MTIKEVLRYIIFQGAWLVIAIVTSIFVIWVLTMVFGEKRDIVDLGVRSGLAVWLFTLAGSLFKKGGKAKGGAA